MKESREELSNSFTKFTGILDQQLKNIQEITHKSAKENRDELAASLKSFGEQFSQNVKEFNELQKQKFDQLMAKQDNLTQKTEEKLKSIQDDNSNKLEKMRETVDEKLHQTLETRLGQSFKLVSERLEQVQKGLGEMQTLASGVGDLKRVLSNVKSKGILGEYQLQNLLDEMLTIQQYSKNVKTKKGSNDQVEFAIKIPSKDDSDKFIWLPIDSKFPTEDYDTLIVAYENADLKNIETSKKALEQRLKSFAKDIKEKYIDPPNTTDFAIMFLPFEGLYAEVLRLPGIFENFQREHKIVITGPTTISAFLSSLQMGFRSLVVEKRTSEIWELLGAIKTEFGKFGTVLQKTKEKLEAVGNEIDNASKRSRAIEKKLKNIQELPKAQSEKLLADLDAESDTDEG